MISVIVVVARKKLLSRVKIGPKQLGQKSKIDITKNDILKEKIQRNKKPMNLLT